MSNSSVPLLLRRSSTAKKYDKKSVPPGVDLTPRTWDHNEDFGPLVFDDFIKPIHKGLYRSGTKIVCPLHDDVNPSMQLYPQGGYHCFGCNNTGKSTKDLVEKVYKKYGFDPKPVLRCLGLEDKESEVDHSTAMTLQHMGWTSEDYVHAVRKIIRAKAPGTVLVQAKLKYMLENQPEDGGKGK